ncbi:hypothetical protein CWC18_07075 [Pseudoalteromonas aurantia]|uniref:glycosyltransferase n=1 Tax=Pseudoalteromonas aurantia TaxID=43654 RepID=UPI00110B1877|nr:glycosyltransferase [Pseudoalteromonas aurantia]TMO64183.1 hypothetical protein CWC18_07075 [Pseudoalteromonas aurantia]
MSKGISVIIPTYNRSELLSSTLKSLSYQNIMLNDEQLKFEVIVIDDGSTDDTSSVVKNYSNLLSMKYIYQEDLGFRVALARNKGIRRASYDICLFLDSGMVAAPDLLLSHYYQHNKTNKLVAIGSAYGMQEFEPSQRDMPHTFSDKKSLENLFFELDGNVDYIDTRQRSLVSMNVDFENITTPWLLCWTCHLSISRNVLKKIGGFDEYFQSWGGEDVELGIRLHKEHCHFLFMSETKAIHTPHTRTTIDNIKTSTSNCAYIHKKHPCDITKILSDENLGWESIVKNNYNNKALLKDYV